MRLRPPLPPFRGSVAESPRLVLLFFSTPFNSSTTPLAPLADDLFQIGVEGGEFLLEGSTTVKRLHDLLGRWVQKAKKLAKK